MSDEKPSFIKENINKQSKASKTLKKILRIFLSAVLFGVVAVCAAVISKPFAEKYLGKEEETTTTEVVTIARDERESSTEETKSTLPAHIEDSDEDTTEEVTTEEETEPVEEVVKTAIDNYEYSIDDLDELWKNVANMCNEIDSSIVTVKAVKNGTDWFDNELDNEGSFSGIVIAGTDTEYMILTTVESTEDTDSIKIKWNTGLEQDAKVRKADRMTGLAILAVDIEGMDEATKEACKVVNLGNSYLLKRGDMLVAVGSPMGTAHSTAYAWVSFIENGVKVTDGTVKLLFTNSNIETDKGSWILNNHGELIGWATNKFSDRTAVASISDFKAILERMINGDKYAYLGIKASDLDLSNPEESFPEINNTEEIPKGIYVMEVKINGPAYKTGIQPGDIITKIGDVTVNNIYHYQTMLENLQPGETVKVIAYRSGRDEYKEIEYDMVVGSRE